MGVKRTVSKVKPSYTIQHSFDMFYINRQLLGREPATLKSYEAAYEQFLNLRQLTGNEPVDTIKSADIASFIVVCQQRNNSVHTINHYLTQLRAWLYFIMDKKLIPQFKVSLISAQETEPKYYTDEEIEKLLAKPTNEDDFVEVRTWVMINFVCGTGARCATLCNAKVKDINFSTDTITYSHTKNKNFQTMPLIPSLKRVLTNYVNTWRPDPDSYLFPTVDDRQMCENSVRLAFNRFCDERQVDSRGIHQLRHSFAHNAIKSGIDPFKLKLALGHKDIKMSEHYAHLWGNDLGEDYADYTILNKVNKSGRTKTIKSSGY